jgi:ATP-dependent helicase/nuclease subunit A
MVERTLRSDDERCLAATFRAGGLEWHGMKWRHNVEHDERAAEPVKPESARDTEMPVTLFEKLPAQKALPRPLAPSGIHVIIDEQEGENVVTSALFSEKKLGAQPQIRGKIIHRLLQSLTDFEPAERPAAATRYLDRAVPQWSASDRQALADNVLAILDDPRFAGLHGENSQAEVSIMGTIHLNGRDYAVSGRMDRMGVTGGDIFILDYKTNLVPPATVEQIPFAHRAQLALYREVLKPIFPGKTVHCLLIYTEGPHLYSLGEADLEKALLAISGQ